MAPIKTNSAAKAMIIHLIAEALSRFSGILALFLAARLLEKSDIAIWGTVRSIVTFMVPLLTFGLVPFASKTLSTNRTGALNDEDLERVFATWLVSFSVVGGLALLLVALRRSPDWDVAIPTIGIAIGTAVHQIVFASWISVQQDRRAVVQKTALAAANMIIPIGALVLFRSLELWILGMFAALVVATVPFVPFAFVVRNLRQILRGNTSPFQQSRVWRIGAVTAFYLFLSGSHIFLNRQILLVRSTSTELADFTVAQQIGVTLLMIMSVFHRVWQPRFYQTVGTHDEDRKVTAWNQMVKAVTLLSVAVPVMALLTPIGIRLILTASYTSAGSSIVLGLAAYLTQVVILFWQSSLFVEERNDRVLYISVVGVSINLVVAWLFAPKYGSSAVMMSLLIAKTVEMLIGLAVVWRSTNVNTRRAVPAVTMVLLSSLTCTGFSLVFTQ